MPTKLQHAVAGCESYLRGHPGATIVEAITALWESFGLDRSDVLPYKQIWFPDDIQESIQREIVRQVWVAAFTEASRLSENLSRCRR